MAVPEGTGYPLKWFNNQETVRDSYECLVCLEVLKDPVQVRDCGHQFCKYCLDRVMKTLEFLNGFGLSQSNARRFIAGLGKSSRRKELKILGIWSGQLKCPSCRKEISNEMIFDDIAAKRLIAKLPVKCPNDGCEWDGCLNSLLQEHTEMCPFHILGCTNAGCNEQVIRRDLEAHLEECEQRTVACEYCNIEHVFKDKAEHLEECPDFPMKCTNNCPQENIARNKMEEHLKTECSETVVKCKFAEFGCNFECQRRKLEEHFDQVMKDHLELLKNKCVQYEKDIQEMKQKCAQYEKDKEEMKQKCVQYEKDIQEMKQKCAQYEKDKKEMKQKVNIAPHLMIIRDFNKKLLEAKNSNSDGRINSDPFYSSTDGYKLKLSVHLNETRQQYKDHMGVYLIIMKSDHDAILSWPFNKTYTITLFDQQDDEKKRENIVYTATPEGQDSYKRPVLDGNSGWGLGKFVSHETLQTRRYVKDNTVFIKFSIET